MSVGGDAQQIIIGGTLTGRVHVGGSLGSLVVMDDVNHVGPQSPVYVGWQLQNQIRVYGSLGDDNPPNQTPEIHIVAGKSDGAGIAIDWDGYHIGDDWQEGALIKVGATEYFANDPDDHIYEVTGVRGDMNNDAPPGTEFPDFGDINPFVLALSDPAGYELAYPGLAETTSDENGTYFSGGSVLFHADCNCDGSVNFADINPFVALVGGTCDPNCPDCQGGDAPMGGGDAPMAEEEPLGPEELAAQLAANIWPELYDDLLFVVAGAIDAAPDEETQAYWEAVYAALTQ